MEFETFSPLTAVLSNRKRVFDFINSKDGTSKQELSDTLNLSMPTVTQCLKDLTAKGLIQRSGYYMSTGGRKASIITAVPKARIAIGVEMLQQSVKITAIDLSGESLKEAFYQQDFSPTEEYFKMLGDLINAFTDSLNLPDSLFLGVGIAVQGLVSHDGETIINGDILNYSGTKRAAFQKNIRLPCRLFHDTEVAAFAEIWHRDNIKNAVYIALNRNLGGALIIGGEVYLGDVLGGCIIEHMRLIPDGRPCYCGQKGCMEAYCSVSSLEKKAGVDVDTFFRRIEEGSAVHKALFDEYLGYLALAINNIRMVIDCKVILGGFLQSYLTEDHFRQLEKLTKEQSPFDSTNFSFQKSVYGKDAAARGAALVLINDFINKL